MSEKSKSNQSTTGDSGNIREKRKNEILGILLTALGLFSGIAIFTSSAGLVGQMLVDFYTRIIGSGCYLIPVLLSIWGIALIRLKTVKFNTRIIGFLLSYITIFAIFHTYLYNNYPLESALQGIGGGYLGGGLAWVLLKLFGTLGTYIVLMSFLLIGNLLWFDVLLHSSLGKIINLFKKLMQKLNQKKLVVEEYIPEGVVSIEDGGNEGGNGDKDLLADDYYFENEEEYNEGQNNREIYNNHKEFTDENVEEDEGNYREGNGNSKGNNQENNQKNEDNINYELPDITLLKRSGRKKVKLENKSNLLEETLKSFGVEATVIDVSHGPSITRYEVQPASGVKVSKIVNLADDIALSLAASDVRIEAPIPGKAAVGIEVPHQGNIFVRIRDVLSSKEFKNAKGKLTLALGKGIDGRPIVADLSSMPHLLVAGATGSGKSVCINTFITSILYKATPDEVKFILVDPKKVELSNYKGLPHLFTPVVVDPKKASSVLKLVVKEMEERYELFSESGTRGINSYNKKVSEEEQLPYIVVI
ncbi:MAG: DNA translocase FtsK 4TM domain-containing protein, partial [Halanaerobiaceae bacterium]